MTAGLPSALLEVGVGAADPFEIPARDNADPSTVERIGKIGDEVDHVTLVDNGRCHGAQFPWLTFAVERLGPAA